MATKKKILSEKTRRKTHAPKKTSHKGGAVRSGTHHELELAETVGTKEK